MLICCTMAQFSTQIQPILSVSLSADPTHVVSNVYNFINQFFNRVIQTIYA